MHIFKVILVVLILFFIEFTFVVAQNKVVVVPMDDGIFVPIVIPKAVPVDPEFLDQALPKPFIFNKGWDKSIGNRTRIDKTVQITLGRLTPVFGYPGITYTPTEIRQWGEQRFFTPFRPIDSYAKGVLLIDKGDTLEGGPFEWNINLQGKISFHNIVRTDLGGWVAGWTDPRPGDKVWFFLMSDDERFSSNPISFIWP